MKSTKKPFNRKIGMLVAKNLIVMLVLIVVGLFSSFSWFTQKTEAKADGISIKSLAPDGLEIAIVEHNSDNPVIPDDEDFKEGTIEITPENCSFLEDLELSEITGTGKNDEFYKPKLVQANGTATPELTAAWDKAVANSHYISFDLYMRSKSKQTVYVQETTRIYPKSSELTWSQGFDGSAYNASKFGNFSKDGIVGAVRFSMVDKTNDLKLLWIPAPNVLLNYSDNVYTLSVNEGSGESFKHYYYDGTATTKEKLESKVNVTTNDKGDYTLGTKIKAVELNDKDDNDVYYTNYVTCHLWVDGEDSEAKLALTGGQFIMELKLTINN